MITHPHEMTHLTRNAGGLGQAETARAEGKAKAEEALFEVRFQKELEPFTPDSGENGSNSHRILK